MPDAKRLPKNKDSTRYASSIQEEAVKSLIGGTRTTNSGAGDFLKGDVMLRPASMLIECKTPMSAKDSFSIKREWIDKTKEEAFGMRMSNTAVAFCFEPGGENHFVISEGLFRFLCEKLAEEYA